MELHDLNRYGNDFAQAMLFQMVFPEMNILDFNGLVGIKCDMKSDRCFSFVVRKDCSKKTEKILSDKSFASRNCVDGTKEYMIEIPQEHEINIKLFGQNQLNRIDKKFVDKLSKKYPHYEQKIDAIFNY